MDNPLLIFWMTAFTALAVENTVFTRVLGLNKHSLYLNSTKTGILYGGVFTVFSLFATPLTTLIGIPFRDNALAPFMRAPLFFLCVAALYVPAYFLLRHKFPSLLETLGDMLPSTAFNTALFGIFYINMVNDHNVLQAIAYALGTGVGYTLAILIIYYARRRLALSPIPRSFRGLPILLVYIGLLSLAIYGLTGQGLPT